MIALRAATPDDITAVLAFRTGSVIAVKDL